eukprot:TRINITY_DN80679_c0_g1_i1.p1 TRINITY_DN80679_c0_g1~~TRINITY_DN80679_c0_g1_i1.p1  ORF type:complete len:1858 (+),score=467.04 TRINITY_DN80679_c0_g1_i1:131-5704(+)
MAPHYGNNGQLSRDERVQLFGIDCDDQIVWTDWTPGNEAVCDLVLQNVALVTQKLKYKLPATPEFDMPYPEPFKLAPGMKKSIPISFRPSKYEPHIDKIQIITRGGTFFVTVKAVVKDIAITVPHYIDFGLCPTHERSEMNIDVYNTGTLKAQLKWHFKPPFTVKLPVDTVEVGGMVRCKVDFEPQSASAFDGRLVLTASRPSGIAMDGTVATSDDVMLGGDVAENALSKQYFVRSTGVGKLPFLCVPNCPRPVVDFGAVFAGNRVTQTLEIFNTTPVRATFRVRALHENGEVAPLAPHPFSVTPEFGMVEPSCSFTLTFSFQSHTAKEHACRRFRISTPGGTPLVVKCQAFCRPMEVKLSTRSINFGEVACGKICTKTLQLHNSSDRPALYHFMTMDHMKGIFWFDRHMGVIPPDSFIVVTVYFGPSVPSNYMKHVHCVVKGSVSPLTLHLLGTAYSEKSRPAFLEQVHVDAFRNMQLRGMREYPRPQPGDETKPRPGMDDDELEDEPLMVQYKPLSATHQFLEMMLPMDSKLRDVTIAPTDLDFGTGNAKQVVTVTNRTSEKVTAQWMLPGESRLLSAPDEKTIFSVYPPSFEIKPMSSKEFEVSFRPNHANTFEGGMLECIVSHKVNRTFRLVDMRRFTPPWTLSVRGMGHTMGNLRNDPRLDISEATVRLRACCPGQRTYQVVALTNPGDTCISYRFSPPRSVASSDSATQTLKDLNDMPFTVYPQQGIIEPHQFHLVVVEFRPTEARNEQPYAAVFPIVVDYNESSPKELHVAGRCWEPKLNFCRGQPVVTLPPACAGMSSSTACEIQNISEIPVLFECRVPSRYRQWFHFPTPTGVLKPAGNGDAVALFTPNRDDTFSAPMYCVAQAMFDEDDIVEGPLKALAPRSAALQDPAPAYVLQFVGHGKGPALQLDPENLDMGAVRACDQVKTQVQIMNSSQLDVVFTIECEFVGSDEQAAAVAAEALELDRLEGVVAGRCTETLKITFSPPCRGLFVYEIRIVPQGGNEREKRGVVFKLQADVQYPFVQIADLRTESSTLQPQSMMWGQFQVDGVNDLYSGEVADVERRFQNAIGIDEKKRLVKMLKPFQLLFGTSAAGSTPTVAYLALSNPSRLKVRFSFQTPKDLGLESAPYWCDEKALVDEREAHFSWVEEHGIYDIQPRSGEIQPGDFLHVKMTYNHHSIGTHILPVVFNVHDGRSVLFYLKAHSVAPHVGCLSVRSSILQLQPVPLNVEGGPVQSVELTNSGGVPAPWRIDMGLIQEHNLNNYSFEVLNVTPSEGVLGPNSTVFLHFTFTPLEAKSYSFPVRIEMLKDGRPAEELLFELRANGYDPEEEKPEVPPYFPVNLPIQTFAPVPGCGAALSIEMLDFGCCPLRSCVSRMLVLVNYTSEFVLSFDWQTRQVFRRDSELIIEPNCGELSPGSHVIITFRVCCLEPVDISGEVACAMDWTHLSSYGLVQEMIEDASFTKPEYLAYHSAHVHEPMRTAKGLAEARHVPVANRLTVSRFRNLMSTAAGQKFLNENLHRTAILASHIPSMSPRKSQKQLPGRGGGGGGNGNTSFAGDISTMSMAGFNQPPQPPTTFPLYVRIRAVVSDWSVPKEQLGDFLVLGPRDSVAPEEEDGEDSDWNRTHRDTHGDQGGGSVHAGGAVGGVLEQLLREIMAEEGFNDIVDSMVKQETPLFAQYEDSAPPGQPEVPQLRFPDADLTEEAGSGDLLRDLLGPDATAGGSSLPKAAAPSSWRSGMLLDFPCGYGGASSSSSEPAATAALASSKAAASPRGLDATASSMGATATENESAEDVARRLWDDALQEYGEVDLDAFKVAAGEVLDSLLLDVMDDVVAGRMNWMRPMPRGRPRR